MRRLWQLLCAFHSDLVNRVSRYLATREVIRVLHVAQAQELRETPGELWPITRQKHIEQIQAVRDGKLDIVDRRSWQYPYLPEALHRLNQPILKNTPYNLRRFSETPIPRRAINLIKNMVVGLDWQIETVAEVDNDAEHEKRIQIATNCFRRPNNVDSFRTFSEAVTEDIIAGGYGCIEPRLTPYYKRPLKMWPVDGSTIRIYADWTESTPDRPRFAQMTGLKGERGIVPFLANELVYIKDNPRSNTPFGLGKLEVAFNSINSFLGAQDMAGKAGSDQVHKTWLWWKTTVPPGHMQTVRRHIQNELEGQAKVSLIAGLAKPDVIDIQPVKIEDLLLEWQEFLIKIIAAAFDLSPLALGMDEHTSRGNVAEVMAISDFRQAVVPMAHRLEEAFTHDIIQEFLGWRDLRFIYLGLDDPDTQTKVAIQQRQWMMSAITADEVREDMGKPPIPGGWGKLTMFQQQLLLAWAQGQSRGGGGGSSTGFGGGGSGSGIPGGSMGTGMGMPGGGGNAGLPGAGSGGGSGQNLYGARLGMVFNAQDIAEMSPEQVGMFQQLGLIPDTNNLAQQMEEAQPGILETLSEQLQDYFKLAEKLDEEDELEPQKVTPKDEKDQQKKFYQGLHTPTVIEQTYQDRLTKQSRQGNKSLNPVQPYARGTYPRSGGRRGWYR